jgi:toxin ParE1/3/4
MTVRYTKRALADPAVILAYVAQQSPQGAASVAARIEAIIEALDAHPRSGRTTSRSNIRVRVAGEYPYLIFYRVKRDGGISIVHIRHAARRPFAG